MRIFVLAAGLGEKTNKKKPAMTNNAETPKLEAHLIASPNGLAKLSDALETALASPIGRAMVEISTPDGERFILHIIRKTDDG